MLERCACNLSSGYIYSLGLHVGIDVDFKWKTCHLAIGQGSFVGIHVDFKKTIRK
jgi:hypothetical protein